MGLLRFFLTLCLIQVSLTLQASDKPTNPSDCERWMRNAGLVFNNDNEQVTPVFALQAQNGKHIEFGPNLMRNPDLISFRADLQINPDGEHQLDVQFKESGQIFYRPRRFSLITQAEDLVGVIEDKLVLVAPDPVPNRKKVFLIDYKTRDVSPETAVRVNQSSFILPFYLGGQVYLVTLDKAKATPYRFAQIRTLHPTADWAESIAVSGSENGWYVALLKNGMVIQFSIKYSKGSDPTLNIDTILRSPDSAPGGPDDKDMKPRIEKHERQYWLGIDFIAGGPFQDDATSTAWLLKIDQ